MPDKVLFPLERTWQPSGGNSLGILEISENS
jgi:hypothetical protein